MPTMQDFSYSLRNNTHILQNTKKQSIVEEINHKIFILIRFCSYAIHR